MAQYLGTRNYPASSKAQHLFLTRAWWWLFVHLAQYERWVMHAVTSACTKIWQQLFHAVIKTHLLRTRWKNVWHHLVEVVRQQLNEKPDFSFNSGQCGRSTIVLVQRHKYAIYLHTQLMKYTNVSDYPTASGFRVGFLSERWRQQVHKKRW
jgi:hypothetical protein